MALFRKSKKASGSAQDKRMKAEAALNEAKWDELERLVSQSNGPDPEPSADVGAKGLGETLDLGSNDFTRAETESIAPELNIDHPSKFTFVDVGTPDAISDNHSDVSSRIEQDEIEESTVDRTSDSQQAAPVPPIAAMAPAASFNESRTEPKRSNAAELDSYNATPPAISRPDRADIGAMRLDVARISADIQSGEELYRRAQQRIENLTDFVERAEIDFSMLNRLEPENRRLKARNRTIEREIEASKQKMSVLRADLEDREHRLSEKTRIYEIALGKLSAAQKSLQEYERALSSTRDLSDRNALNSERLQTSLDVERRENEVLRERIADVAGEIEAKQSAFIEAKKMADSLAQDCADFRHHAEGAEKEADELRKSLATAQTQNNAMKAEMVSLHDDIRSFKSQSEFTIISREDEMAALQQQVDHLRKQLEIKDEIVRNAARDVQDLRKIRTAQDLERERLEGQLETQSYQLEQANSELLKTKQDVTDFDRRYQDVATALSVSQARRMSNTPSETPDIGPSTGDDAPLEPIIERTKKAQEPDDEFEGMGSDEVSDRVMDFKLGLRKDLT